MDNASSLDWHMPVSAKPELFAISVVKNRFTRELIDSSQVFAVNYIPFSLKDAAVFCGTYTGMHMDKFKQAGLEKANAEKIDCPVLKDALRVLECRVVHRHEIGDNVVYFGEVLHSVQKRQGSRLFHRGNGEFFKI
jgi:flavin reductase (DIM6/NTAB) family NADH-FMN oxidoreductase RutF